ncbi:putative mitochondrial exoribonuclease DSS-1 [Leishmania infantum JPCM5]|uniref:Mitochondrial_exoribonuclease_DSS-1_-_putative n=2 Tax=Leishmania infantum TaxID=5671 RepID=A0A6L0WRR3_LEIIN|nr:putative mitochondrial exoribonuclease DSS-1 [Leishmania infantum JPCM5]CAC9440883.1 mitochondrial_exoribonuclease_DSS-1_-_putative [Leishmania infantum]CAM65056.1 putative mitochondrial exoribonuclease DSS-1 [Leishmania infantum JPCM5]SUZ38829.1 mitochondrial_exoribonuclease_DSS-1_-_putative [Leishmania infantum]|eukprot:XP_001462870.1 putative mitochondrial exoribonuclease DSS-1 [Leishmania infantum JPCM5]
MRRRLFAFARVRGTAAVATPTVGVVAALQRRGAASKVTSTTLGSPAKSSHHTTSSTAPRTIIANAAAQFSGTYLDVAWTRQFILGSLLQRYDPLRYAPSSPSSPSSITARLVESALLESQRLLSSTWKLPVRPLDAVSEARILRLLARYAAGEGILSDTALEMLQRVLARLPGAPACISDPVHMRTLLELIGYVEPGDNLSRVAYAGELRYPPQAHAFMTELLAEVRQRDGGDAFDAIRERRTGPGYAIDSATTSEVDDAIGVSVDGATGAKYFVVYVSDATVYCPFDSTLEQLTARRLTTTTYLPEGVFFMLPKPIVEAATLREDRPCRTFNVIFQIDESTGEVKNYSVAVGWLDQLRRITYDQVQEIINEEEGREDGDEHDSTAVVAAAHDKHTSSSPPLLAECAGSAHPPPAWMTREDKDNLFYILRCARLRLRARLERQQRQRQQHHRGAGGKDCGDEGVPATPPVDFSLPDPLIEVKGTEVLSVTDQVISTQDARLAVAELMIAANEVCSRVAQANHIAMPFRGTRALSSDHLVAHYYTEPEGVRTLTSLDASHIFLAEAMQSSVRRLSTVTRAIYHHVPLHHAGLDTTFYTHSTSPLRRYADMLVHHQLKTWLWQQRRGGGSSDHTSAASTSAARAAMVAAPQQLIPEHAMASLCAMISAKQERASLLQDNSTRFWILRYLEDLERASANAAAAARGGSDGDAHHKKTYLCLVGETRRVVAAPAYSRFACSSAEMSQLLSLPLTAPSTTSSTVRRPASLQMDAVARWRQETPEFTYVSDVYIPEVQLAHTITHHRDDVLVGAVLECHITRVQPTQGVLELAIERVLPGGDERHYERLWMGGFVSQLDA